MAPEEALDLRIIICSALVCFLLTAGIACGGDDDGGGTPTASGEVPGTPRPTAPTNFPEDFPEDFPLYPGAELDSGIRIGFQVIAVFSSLDSRGDVADFYREALDQEPWELDSEAEGNPGTILMLFKHTAEDIRGTMTLHTVPSGTAININFTVAESVGPTLPPVNLETGEVSEPPSETE